jgi:hypothetical protein
MAGFQLKNGQWGVRSIAIRNTIPCQAKWQGIVKQIHYKSIIVGEHASRKGRYYENQDSAQLDFIGIRIRLHAS